MSRNLNIALYGRKAGEHLPLLIALITKLKQRNHRVILLKSYADIIGSLLPNPNDFIILPDQSIDLSQVDFMFSIGGDGTMLSSVPIIRDSQIPVIGLNLGRLGFLSSITRDEDDAIIHALESGDFFLDKRSLIEVSTEGDIFGKNNFGLNECTVSKLDTSSMIMTEVHVNGHFFSNYWADGLIISTPTGSTAYNLSCGGPVISPDCSNFVITPIAPHNLNTRPIIIPDDCEIKLRVQSRSNHYLAAIDSKFMQMDVNAVITIRKASFNLSILRLKPDDYLNTLRTKLLWGSDTRNYTKFAN